MAAAPFLSATGHGFVLRLHVVPGAAATQVAGLHGGRLKIKVAAPPEKGAANRELLAFLARRLGLPKSALRLTAGAQNREKTVAVEDPSPDLGERLLALLPPEKTG